MPSLSVTIPCATEDDLFFPSSSTSQHPPVSIKTPFEGGSGSDSDTDSNASSLNLSEEWHVNSPCPVAIEEDKEDGQVLLIPHTSPFFKASSTSSGPNYSSPSVCPTLSGKFDMVHSALNTSSKTTFVKRVDLAMDSRMNVY